MSRKKEAALQQVIANDKDFEDCITTSGRLTVVDAYPKWTGPCKVMCSTLKRLRTSMGDNRLHFAVACIEDIPQLLPYLDTSPEPLFLWYADGLLVDRIRGCNVPEITKKIKLQLENEMKISNGEQERVGISHVETISALSSTTEMRKSIVIERRNTLAAANNVENDEEENTKQVTFAGLTHNYLEKAAEINEILTANGIDILEQRQHNLTREDILTFSPGLEEKEGSEEFINYVTNNTSNVYVLTRKGELGVGVIAQMIDLIGPSNQDQAQKEAPESINAKYGSLTMFVANDADMANAAISRLFPEFRPPACSVESSASMGTMNMDITGSFLPEEATALAGKLQNYGCTINTFKHQDAANDEGVTDIINITCSRSLQNIRNFCSESGYTVDIAECAS